MHVSPEKARELIAAGALLVAAYRRGPGFTANYLDGAIPIDEFAAEAARIEPGRPIIFY